MLAAGFALAVASAICNGSFGIFNRFRAVQAAQIPPQIYNLWFLLGISISSTITLFTSKLVFTPWGLLSGALLGVSTGFAFVALQPLGVALATGIWSGTAIIVSFLFGAVVIRDPINNIVLAGIALVLLLVGTVFVAYAGFGSSSEQQDGPRTYEEVPTDVEREALVGSGAKGTAHSTAAAHDDLSDQMDADGPRLPDHAKSKDGGGGTGRLQLLAGAGCAVACGAFGGLLLAPMHYAPPSAQGIAYLPSFATGIVLAVPPVTAVLNWLLAGTLWVPLQLHQAALPGCASGCVWNVGNVCSILAVPYLGLAVSYPIMQCGLFVAGMWGVLLFGEIRGRWQALYWAGGAVIVAGAALLAASKL